MSHDITGTIIAIMEVQPISATFRKRNIVIECDEKGDGKYPEFIQFEAIQDKTDILDMYQPGQVVNISFNLKGRKWTNPQNEVKYFNSLQLWKITAEQGQVSGPAPAPYQQAPVTPLGGVAGDVLMAATGDFNSGLDSEVPF